MEIKEIRHMLERCELFNGLKKTDIEKIADICRVDTYRAGEYVFHQGEIGEHIYIIDEGHVFLERSMDLGIRRGNVVIGMLSSGRAFGCWSTLLDEPHDLMSSARCKKSATVLVISGAGLRRILLEDFELGFKVMEKICLLLRGRIQGAWGAMEKI